MYIVLCDRCGQEIRTENKMENPIYPRYSVRETAIDRYTGAEMAADMTLCPVCRENLRNFMVCADRMPVTETLARKRAIRRAHLRAAMEGAYYEEKCT